MVRIHPDPPAIRDRLARDGARESQRLGAVAQLGERLLCKQEVIGSIPLTSILLRATRYAERAPQIAKQNALRSCAAAKQG